MITTRAWTLHPKDKQNEPHGLVLEDFSFTNITEDEILAEPLFGCWEGNMEHAIKGSPIDICRERNEDKIVIGNAGVVRVLKVGQNITNIKQGETGLIFCNGEPDRFGYPKRIYGYDAPNTIGVLAKRIKLKQHQILPVPEASPVKLEQWAAFSLRYITAWANWKIAYRCWRSQMDTASNKESYVVAWGGGVSIAELELARDAGFNVAMITSQKERMALLKTKGIAALDRSSFRTQSYDADFQATISDFTQGNGVDIFIDNIGANFRSTVGALARQGVVTTCGWREGMTLPVVRAAECIKRHIHVFTHYAKYEDGLEAVEYAVNKNWLPPMPSTIYSWDNVPQLADDYAKGLTTDYFPIFSVNT